MRHMPFPGLTSQFAAMRPGLVSFASRLVDADSAEDLVQEAFVRALESGRSDLSQLPEAYFRTIVRNLAMDFFGRRSRDRLAAERMHSRAGAREHAEVPHDVPAAGTLDDDIRQRLEELSQRQWESLVMTVVLGLTERQAASASAVSRAAVTGGRERALQLLRQAAQSVNTDHAHVSTAPPAKIAPPRPGHGAEDMHQSHSAPLSRSLRMDPQRSSGRDSRVA